MVGVPYAVAKEWKRQCWGCRHYFKIKNLTSVKGKYHCHACAARKGGK